MDFTTDRLKVLCHAYKVSGVSKIETNTGLSLGFRKLTTTNFCSTTCMDIVLISLMCNYGHVLHAVHVYEPLWWVYRESSHGTKELFNLPTLALKARHLGGSAFC